MEGHPFRDGRMSLYVIQALSRGEMPSENERQKLKAILGEFRQLDIEFLENLVSKIESSDSTTVSLNDLRKGFEKRRVGIINRHSSYLGEKNKKLKRLLANYLNRVESE